MEAYKLNFILLLIVGVISSFILVPDRQEMAYMFLKDRQFTKAETIYEELHLINSPDRNSLIPLNKIFQGKGETDTTILMYENYLKKNPQDIEVWEKLSELYSESQRIYDHIEVLEKVLKKKPGIERYVRLIALYDATGIKDERLVTALEQLIELDPKRERDRLDLIKLQAGKGNLKEANKIMDEYMRRFSASIEDSVAELRLRLLLSSGRIQDAFNWAEQWLKKHQDVSFRYMALLYSGGQSSNLDAAVDTVAAIDPERMPAWLVSAIMKAGWDASKMKFLERFVTRLSSNVVSEYPVVMARLALKNGDDRGLEKWLKAAEVKKDLTTLQQTHLMMIYFMTDRTTEGLALLSKLQNKPKVAASELVQAVPYILKSDYINEGLKVFESLRIHIADSDVNNAWALLATAAGETQAVTKWLNDEADKKLSRRMLNDLYYTAADRSHFELASAVGRYVYAQYKGHEEAYLLINALLGTVSDSSEVNTELVTLLQEQMHVDGLSREERRAMAFQLLKVGGKQEAADEFKLLAATEGPQGKNVQQLLFIWGPMPGNEALDWLEARARTAPFSELAGWWRHMINAGGAERVAAEMEIYIDEDIPAEAEDVLTHALITTDGFPALEKQLRAQNLKTEVPVRLEQLAGIAASAGLKKTEHTIWQHLYELESTNTKAIKALAIEAFNRGDLPMAENYLTGLSALKGEDWESAFYLGEIYSSDSRQSLARVYYEKSLELVETELEPQKRTRIARAYLLYRLGKIEEAITAYDELIKKYQDDLELRAEYSAVLIEEGYLDMANKLLEQQR